MEERTSFFINLAGIHIQQALHLVEDGVPSRRLYKVLANAIADWHWLSSEYPEKFAFDGAGWLTWVPHRFGALGFVVSNMEYGPQIRLNCGLFPNMIDLFESGIYAKYGFRGVKKDGDERRLLFAPFMQFDLLRKSRTGPHEQHFWPKLVEVYAKLDDKTLDALASCRNETMSAHSLWIQLVSWKRYMGRVVDILQQMGGSPKESEKRAIRLNFDEARTCLKQFFVKIGYRKEIGSFIEKARAEAFTTEFNQLIPCLHEVPDISAAIGSKFVIFEQLSPFVEAVHGVCGELRKLVEANSANEQPDRMALEKNLKKLGTILPASELLDLRRWLLLLMQQNVREIARLCSELVEEVFAYFEDQLDLAVLRLTPHYKAFLATYYPLPTEHFIKGN
jgi:hypothetical protein